MAGHNKTARRRKTPAAQTRATSAKAATAPSSEPAPPKGVFATPPDQLERYLLTGQAQGVLEDYFGADALVQLQDLARQAAARGVRSGPRVLILPGIMGSTLAKKTSLGDDVLWVDPLEIALGHLTRLRLDGGSSTYFANGVILFAYLKLKLRLILAGFDADFFPFDWRLSLDELGAALAERVAKEPSAQISLVAHSMGGLVARAAWKAISRKVSRLVMLGTPNYGSFAPVQALRGAYDVVSKIAVVDVSHTATDLAAQIFSTFPGLYQMLPVPAKFNAIDLYDLRSWPQSQPRPAAAILGAVAGVVRKLADADPKFYLIAGVNRDTVVGVQSGTDEFVYTVSPDGDGTVPLGFAELDGLTAGQTYFVEEGHGSLPNNDLVDSAVVDLLRSGSTAALPRERPQPSRAVRTVREAELIRMAQRSAGISQLGASDYRSLLEPLAAPPRAKREVPATASAAAAAAGSAAPAARAQALPGITIARQLRRRIDVTLAHGSITDADAPAYALGVFRNVAPSGAARAIDERLGGAISEFTARRMFNGDLGSVFNVPVGRNRMPAGMVMFVGLGAFDQFTREAQQLAAENLIRVIARSRIDEFATVLIGAGTGQSAGAVLETLMTGFLRGLQDADPKQRFRSITFCETDGDRFAEMKAEMYRMAATRLFDDIELTLREAEIPPPPEAATSVLRGPEPIYVTVRQQPQKDVLVHSISMLGSGLKAAVITGASEVDKASLQALLREFDSAVDPRTGRPADVAAICNFGTRFVEALLPPEVCAVLPQMKNRHVVVVHDTPSSRIPWETLTIGDWSPALECGLSRLYAADHLPAATWMEQRRAAPKLHLLLVVDPSGNLPGAVQEGDRIEKLAGGIADVEVTPLRQGKATRGAILEALRSGQYDCIHYAGHAFFDESAPGRSGLLCANDEVLAGADLRGIGNLPYLVFFNACEGARIRGGGRPAAPEKGATEIVLKTAGIAESLMRGGIANYLSTYWPVNDTAAMTFAETFYTRLLEGQSLGSSVLAGRQALNQKALRDWADYVLTGSHDFVLKCPANGP